MRGPDDRLDALTDGDRRVTVIVTVDLRERFQEITVLLEERTKLALSGAALEATSVANAVGGKYANFKYVAVHPIPDGWESAVEVDNRLLANIYDKGTLGKHTGKLKQPGRRKASWTVKQRNRTYTAHRRDVTGKGVKGTGWRNKARAAGRKVLLAEVNRLV